MKKVWQLKSQRLLPWELRLGSIRRLSGNGQTNYWVKDVITDLLGS